MMSAPVVFVMKSNEDIRLCGDYRMTDNKVIDTCSYHLPPSEISPEISQSQLVLQK